MFQKTLEEGFAGDNVGILLRGVTRENIERGMVLAKPGTITPHTNFESEVYVLTTIKGVIKFGLILKHGLVKMVY